MQLVYVVKHYFREGAWAFYEGETLTHEEAVVGRELGEEGVERHLASGALERTAAEAPVPEDAPLATVDVLGALARARLPDAG